MILFDDLFFKNTDEVLKGDNQVLCFDCLANIVVLLLI